MFTNLKKLGETDKKSQTVSYISEFINSSFNNDSLWWLPCLNHLKVVTKLLSILIIYGKKLMIKFSKLIRLKYYILIFFCKNS